MSEFFVHPTSVVDEKVYIGEGTKIFLDMRAKKLEVE